MKIPTLKIDGVFYKSVESEDGVDSCHTCAFTDESGEWCNKLRAKINRTVGDDYENYVCDGSYQYRQLELQDLPDADIENAIEILTVVNKEE